MLQQLDLTLFTNEAKYYSSVVGGTLLFSSSCLARASASLAACSFHIFLLSLRHATHGFLILNLVLFSFPVLSSLIGSAELVEFLLLECRGPNMHSSISAQTPMLGSTMNSMKPICDSATSVLFLSQSGLNGSPRSRSLSPCRKNSSRRLIVHL